MPEINDYYTVKQFAAVTGRHVSSINRSIKSGRFKALMFKGAYLISKREFTAVIKLEDGGEVRQRIFDFGIFLNRAIRKRCRAKMIDAYACNDGVDIDIPESWLKPSVREVLLHE